MERFVFDVVGSATGLGAYGLILGILFACGLGFPLPEDVALITGGYLAHKGQASLGWMMAVGFGGILAGDSIIFWLGRLGRRAEGIRLLRRHLTPERIAKVEAQFARRGPVVVAIARFLPGIRAATYFVAGGARMPYGRFLLYDGIAALLSAPVFVFLGYRFGAQIGRVVGWAEQFHTWLIVATVVAGGLLFARALLARRKAPEEAAEPAPRVRPPHRAMPSGPRPASLPKRRSIP